MKNEKSPSHILPIILMVLSIILMSNMIGQLERNSIKKTNEIQNLKMELDITNDKLINCKNKVLDKEIRDIKADKSKWETFFITGYTANSGEQGTNEIVATMFNLDLNRVQNLPIIAVDPKIIPLYSIIEIEGLGAFIALDTGGLIKGNRIDILFNSKSEATEFGKQIMKVRIIKNDDV